MLARALLSLAVAVVAACGNEPRDPCADTTEAVAMPTPLWGEGAEFAPPADDAAAGLLLDRDHPWPQWYEQLDEPTGWPRRVAAVVPLSGSVRSIDSTEIRFFGADSRGGALDPVSLVFDATLTEDGRSVMIQAREPAPAGMVELAMVFGPDAVGADPLPACGPSGAPHSAYAEASGRLPAGVEAALAVPIPLSSIQQDLARVHEHLAALPSLQVASVEARALEDYTSSALPADVMTHVQATTAYGRLSLPSHTETDGWFELDADGLPISFGSSDPGFIVTLPESGSAPFPVVFFQHGAQSYKTDLLVLAGPLSAAGFAMVAIDLPFHGERSVGGGVFAMVDFTNPLATRDNIRQAAIDQMTLITGLASLDEALAPVFGPGPHLDPNRLFFVGTSMGAVSGSVAFALSPEVRAATLFAGGAGFSDLGSHGVFSYFIFPVLERPPLERHTVLGLLEILLEGADAFAYAQHSEDRSRPPRPVLFMQPEGDAIVSIAASDALARAFGADLVVPFTHAVDGMEPLPVPAGTNFSWGSDATTRLLLQHPQPEAVNGLDWHRQLTQTTEAQTLVANCFSAVLTGEACRVVSDAFAR